jgi:hypothetical protein
MIVTVVGVGCGGRRRRQARNRALDETPVADGEAVWSRRPDAGVKSSRSKLLGGDGGKQARSPRRARRKPLKPLRREGRVFRWTCGDALACFLLFARGAAGAAGTRLSLRPLFFKAKEHAQLGRIAPREGGGVLCRHCEEQSDEAIHSSFAATWIASLRSQ